MTEYIEKEAAEKILYDGCHTSNGRECPDDVVELWHMVQAIPAADVAQVRHGAWIPSPCPGIENGYLVVCSKCSLEVYISNDCEPTNYCPNCGAKMRGDANE